MTAVLAMLFGFVGLGLASQRLGKGTYPAMMLLIAVYIVYAFVTG